MLLLNGTPIAQCNKESMTRAVVLYMTILIIYFIGSHIPLKAGISFASIA